MELYVLYEEPAADQPGAARAKIGVGGELLRKADQTQTASGKPLKLAFKALFKEPAEASAWEQRLTAQLGKSGVQIGHEFVFVDDALLATLREIASQADEHEWLIPLGDAESVQMTVALNEAKREVEATFERWSQCTHIGNAEIKINSWTEMLVRNDKRIRELEAQKVTPRFYNDGATRNEKLDYTIAQIREDSRQRQADIKRLKFEIDEAEAAFTEWQKAIKRVDELEAKIASLTSPESE